jgi:hypothetical protein
MDAYQFASLPFPRMYSLSDILLLNRQQKQPQRWQRNCRSSTPVEMLLLRFSPDNTLWATAYRAVNVSSNVEKIGKYTLTLNTQSYRTHKHVYHSSHFCAVVLALLLNNMLFALGLVAPCAVLAVRAPCALSSLDPCSQRATKLSNTLGRRPLPCCCRAIGEPAASPLLLAKGLRVLTTCTLLLPWKGLGAARRPGMCTGSGGRLAFS